MILQQRKRGFVTAVFSLCSVLWFALYTPAILEAETVTIDADEQLQVLDGWGTALCWWGNIIGNYPDNVRDTIADLIFDTADGLGLNIIRYNIGGGDAPSHNHMGVGKEMEGFKASTTAEFDWTKDKGQRWVVQAAKERIPPDWFIAEAFSNSPPYWMTNSGCASGAANSADNLKSTMYGEFADYLTETVKHFRDAWGIPFTTLEPLNEPAADWWNVNGGQEGCTFSRGNQAKLIKEVYKNLEEKALTTKIAASDESGYDEMITTYNSFDTETKSCIYQINTHGYGGSKRSELNQLARKDGKKLWASEIDGSGAPQPFDKWTHDHSDIVPGLDIANRIIRDLRELQPNGWVFWEVVESEQAQISLNKNWGCLHADFTGGTKFYVCKKYHAYRQFTRFIRPFSQMVRCTGTDAVAFMSSSHDRLVIVQRNASNSDITITYALQGLKNIGVQATAFRTSAAENCKQLDNISVPDGKLTVVAKAQSITTYCVDVEDGTVAAHTPLVKKTSASPVRIIRLWQRELVAINSSSSPVMVRVFDVHGAHLHSMYIGTGRHLLPLPAIAAAQICVVQITIPGGKVTQTIVASVR